jgi:invasion protein IalB
MRYLVTKLPALFLGASLIFGGQTVVIADSAVTSEVKRTQYQDWSVLCNKNGKAEICQMQQGIMLNQNERKVRLLQTTVTLSPDKKVLMELMFPLGVDLRSGILMQVDDNPEIRAGFVTCIEAGCIVVLELNDALLQQFKKGNKAKVGFRGMGQKDNAVLELSLKGFSAASAQLKNTLETVPDTDQSQHKAL